jgi:hypothetical protein
VVDSTSAERAEPGNVASLNNLSALC